MYKMIFVATILMFITSSAFALDRKAIIISQKNIPIKITDYDADYNEGNKYETPGIYHKIKYKNTGTKRIEAIQFGLVSFDAWNEYLDKTLGFSSQANDPGDSEEATWITQAYSGFSFMTGFAYVSKIRYSDGVIWKADLDEIRSELIKIQKDFDMKELESKPDKK